MVGWNVAAMQLVAGQVLYEISILVHFASTFTLLINEYDEHVVCLNERMFASAMYMKDYASQYVLCFKLYILAFYACSCSWGHLTGYFCQLDSILLASQRVGDVTVWYQSEVVAWA